MDSLLESPRYGERWGRHWMDVWRYSDWYGRRGLDEQRNSARHIWHWRDWIIESLNADKGYDRMIREMLAGDEIAPNDPKVASRDRLPRAELLPLQSQRLAAGHGRAYRLRRPRPDAESARAATITSTIQSARKSITGSAPSSSRTTYVRIASPVSRIRTTTASPESMIRRPTRVA